MAGEDREQSFEKALARHLRAKSAQPAGAPQVCADAETLAAYHERLLGPQEMISWKEHIAACPRCQELLAHLEQTDAIPVDSEENAAVPARKAGAAVLEIAQPRRARRWLWTAPAGALAAGLLIWVTMHERTPQLLPAKTEGPASPAPTDLRSEAAAAEKHLTDLEKLESGRSSRSDSARDKSKQQLLSRARPVQALPKPSDERKDSAIARNSPDLGENLVFDAKKNLPAKDAEEAEQQSAAPRGSAMSEPLAARPQQPPPAAPSAAPAPHTPSKAKSDLALSAAPQPQRKQEVQELDGMSKFRQEASVRLANSKSPAPIVAPGGKIMWQVGPAGAIERSEDAGATWTIQASGVIADLVSGSAASDKVCWVVGKAGTILRTTDGGAHWAKLQPPVQADFTSVFAVNAQQASVSAAQANYQTLDGGATWKKLPPE